MEEFKDEIQTAFLTLSEISDILGATDQPIEEVLSEILIVLEKRMKLKRGTITLINPQTGDLEITMAYGLSIEEKKRGVYKLGEGITGKVVESGKAMFIPDILKEPQFLNRTQARNKSEGQQSFFCVPIRDTRKVLGALSVDKNFSDIRDTDNELRLLMIVTNLIAQHVKSLQRLQRERDEFIKENQLLKSELKNKYDVKNIIGRSRVMNEVFEKIALYARIDGSVLIRGENGTGKELVAQAIHYHSERKNAVLIKFSCASKPAEIQELELFGTAKSESSDFQMGRLEMSRNGSLFIDEISEMGMPLQQKLLTLLKEKEFERPGTGVYVPFKARLIASAQKNLDEQVKKGLFLPELYQRLSANMIYVPALRERGSDIDLLVDYYVQKFSVEYHKRVNRVSTEAINLLNSYHWPGNVKELENCIERAVTVCAGDTIQVQHLPPTLQGPSAETDHFKSGLSLKDLTANFEKELIVDTLKLHRGNKSKAAKQLHTTERILGYKIEQYQIDFMAFRK